MEYLMTYGWAILIIAIVLVALFSLGVFNSANFAPKAPPGSCQVIRPFGAGTTQDMNLEGECNGELPQYAASFEGSYSNVTLPAMSQENNAGQVTYSVWFLLPAYSSLNQAFFGDNYQFSSTRNGYDMFLQGGTNILSAERFGDGYNTYVPDYTTSISTNTWYFGTETYNGVTFELYVNGELIDSSASNTIITQGSLMTLGSDGGGSGGSHLNGYLSNFQAYNTSLSQNDIQSLYREGIGGAPIDLQNLVGWWPLNGNANDYSGNQNNGAANNVIYTTSWTNGYTTP